MNFDKLQECFDTLWAYIADVQAGEFETVSFRHGLIEKEEGFKQQLIKKSRSILQNVPWNDPNIIGSKKIFRAAQELLASCPHADPSKKQILVDYRDVNSLYDYSDSQIKQIEEALYILYTDSNDEHAFNMLSKIFRGKYALVSFFFFLKDDHKYQVVRPERWTENFQMIGVSAQCVRNCTWKNYQEYLSVLRKVQEFLNDRLYEEVSLTDTHSFLWMFHHIRDRKIDDVRTEQKMDEDCNKVYISAKEGRKIHYYTSKYERVPELRTEAIRIHGYTCAACGFNFEEHFGLLGKEFIEVHHAKPLFSFEGEMEVNPETDMVCLCANCHRMIHRKKNAILTVDDLKEYMIKTNHI